MKHKKEIRRLKEQYEWAFDNSHNTREIEIYKPKIMVLSWVLEEV